MKKHYFEIVNSADTAAANLLNRQILDKNDFNYGGFVNPQDGTVAPGTGSGCLITFIPVYFCEDSSFYKDPEILNAANLALDFTKRVQREDGTFDLLISNFYSAPDTGFIMHNLGRAYKILDKHAKSDEELKIKDKLYSIIKIAAKGLCEGGFHTPNHRWVITAGLTMAYNITGEDYLKDMALKYLSEGIDIDENGEFTERSPGIYNAVNDNALMIIAEELRMVELYKPVEMNLNLMFKYIEPDGTVFTQNSVRVDKGEGMPGKAFYPLRYYHIALNAGYTLNNGAFAKFADLILNSALTNGNAPNALWLYMIKEGLKEFEVKLDEIPESYEVFYEPSNIVRKREGSFSATILGGSSNFLFVQKGRMRCYVKMCASFFAVAQFKPKNIEKTTEGYRMTFNAHGRYRLPFDTPPKTSDWRKMDHSKRKTVNHVDLDYIVDIKLLDEGVELKVKTNGCDRVPFKIEFCFTGNCKVQGDGFIVDGKPGNSIVVGKGNVKASLGNETIEVGPGFMAHSYAENMRGSDPQSKNDYTVYFTDYTNVDRTINLTVK